MTELGVMTVKKTTLGAQDPTETSNASLSKDACEQVTD